MVSAGGESSYVLSKVIFKRVSRVERTHVQKHKLLFYQQILVSEALNSMWWEKFFFHCLCFYIHEIRSSLQEKSSHAASLSELIVCLLQLKVCQSELHHPHSVPVFTLTSCLV